MLDLRFRALAAATLLLGPMAHANIVLLNDPSLPPSADGFNITRDTDTGHEWLDVDLSAGRSYADLTGADGSNEFVAGGDFEGFRYATHEQLTGAINGPQLPSLYRSLGISPFGFSSIGGYAPARSLITIAGCFASCGTYGYSNGVLVEIDGVTPRQVSMEAFTSQGFNWGRSETSGGPIQFPPNDAFPLQSGNWLIRDMPVDTDGDSVPDASDNCELVVNPAQIDADGDGLGNWCDADLNNDCAINTQDLGLLKAAFFGNDPVADLNSDGIVNVVELGLLKASFFDVPGPSGLPDICDAP